MRILSLCAFFVVAFSPALFAFNTAEWTEKREALNCEAERLHSVYSNCLKRTDAPAEDVTVPLEKHEDGSLKTVVFAKRARYYLNEGIVFAEDVVVRKFDKDGEENSRIEAKSCVIDRFTKSGWAEGPASVKHHKTLMKGEDVYFSSPENYVKTYRRTDVFSTDLKVGGLR